MHKLFLVFFIAITGFLPQCDKHQASIVSQGGSGEAAKEIALPTHKASHYTLPDSLSFAGETVPLDDTEVRERLIRELMAHSYLHGMMLMNLRRAGRWKPMLTKVLKKQGIPEDFFYLAVAESNLDNNAISYKNAVGMWQFLRDTGREFGLEIRADMDQRRHPEKATEAACRYLNKSYKKFNNWTLVAAAYNRGNRATQNALDDQKVDNYYDLYLTEESYRYVFRIIAIKLIMENPESYGFTIDAEDIQQPFSYKKVELKASIPHLPDFAIQQGTNYKMVKYMNPWLGLGTYTLNIPKGKSYSIWLPK